MMKELQMVGNGQNETLEIVDSMDHATALTEATQRFHVLR
jgi:hypothetical protein